MDRYSGYESMLARVEQKKVQVKGQLPTFYSHLVDNIVAFVLDQVNECCNVVTVDATTDTTEDHLLPGSNEPVARAFADDTRVDVSEHVNTVNPQVDHHSQVASGSISNEQSVSPPSPPSVTHSTIPANIEVKVEDESNGQSVQLCEWIKKEEDEDDYEEQLFHCCDCGGEGCEECRVKLEIKEEFDESGETEQMENCVKQEIKEEFDESGFETELGGNSGETGQGFTRVKKEEEEDELEDDRPKKMRRIDRALGNGPVGSSPPSPNVIVANVEGPDDQMYTSSTHPITIEDHTQPSQHVTVPHPIPIVTSSSSTQHVNETLRDESLNPEPMMMDNVGFEVRTEEFDREQVDHDNNSTFNQAHQVDEETEVDANQNDDMQDEEEGGETIEQREDMSAGDEQQVQVPAQNFVKRIEPADELGNRFECDFQGCAKRMKHRSNLITHIRAHIGEKPFKCSIEDCNGAFVTKGQLKDHLNSHSGTRSFVCTWSGCEARFAQKGNLTAHFRTHTGERPFECDQCNATFTQHSHLVTHLRTHTGERPFVCTWPECGQAFISSSHLKAHSHVHSIEHQFVCEVTGCTKVYKHKVTLHRHQKDQHNLP